MVSHTNSPEKMQEHRHGGTHAERMQTYTHTHTHNTHRGAYTPTNTHHSKRNIHTHKHTKTDTQKSRNTTSLKGLFTLDRSSFLMIPNPKRIEKTIEQGNQHINTKRQCI